ncbi:MAG: thiol-disulfide isomerase/thioredoxin [Polaribacter sp.]|jgi:thiol-disulfide isomerase/thioredoxin
MLQRFILLFLGISLVACQTDKEATTANSFTLSGIITNAKDKAVTLSRGDFKQAITLDETGSFTTELSNIKPGIYSLVNARKMFVLYLESNGDLKMTADAGNFKSTAKYTGGLALQNTYLMEKGTAKAKVNINYKTLLSANESDFLSQVDERVKASTDELNSFEGLPEDFKAFEEKGFDYERLHFISQYEPGHQYFTKNDNFKASDDLKKPLEGIDYDNEENFLNYQDFQNLVMGAFNDDDLMVNIEKLKTFKSEKIKTSVVGNLKYMLSPTMDNLEESYNALAGLSNDTDMNKDLAEIYNVLKALTKGSPSPSFNFVDRNGKEVQLADLKGKNVYIDVWATWCGPCKAEIPSLKALEKEYHNKNIEFVSISIDKQKDADKWKAMIEEKDLKGVQLMADKDWKSDFVQGYGIKGIPRFIMVDDKGLIVSADAARPSDDENVKKLFSELGI